MFLNIFDMENGIVHFNILNMNAQSLFVANKFQKSSKGTCKSLGFLGLLLDHPGLEFSHLSSASKTGVAILFVWWAEKLPQKTWWAQKCVQISLAGKTHPYKNK